MPLSSEGMSRYRGYILYGKSIDNILQRIVSFAEGCRKIVIDLQLSAVLSRHCDEKPPIQVGIKSYEDVDNLLKSLDEGYVLVFPVESPREDVHAVALIPVDKFNKSRVAGD